MIVRIVKMTFALENVDRFKEIFEASRSHIRKFPGVLYLEFLQDKNQPTIFFTYSHWNSTEDLENYRKSMLFKEVWSETKPLFAQPAEAWSTDRLHQLK